MKKRLLAVMMALCISSLETMGAFAVSAESGTTSEIAMEENGDGIVDSDEIEEEDVDYTVTQENESEGATEEEQEDASAQDVEISQEGETDEEISTDSEEDDVRQDFNDEEDELREVDQHEESSAGSTDEETVAIEEPEEAEGVDSAIAVMSGECGAEGNNLTWELSGSDTELTLTIKGSGKMASYSEESKAPWAASAENIKNIVLSEEMTSIGDYAFSECSNLEEISIPENITSINVSN